MLCVKKNITVKSKEVKPGRSNSQGKKIWQNFSKTGYSSKRYVLPMTNIDISKTHQAVTLPQLAIGRKLSDAIKLTRACLPETKEILFLLLFISKLI
jgi:hypothetical protein